jgi:hypothetical protein
MDEYMYEYLQREGERGDVGEDRYSHISLVLLGRGWTGMIWIDLVDREKESG